MFLAGALFALFMTGCWLYCLTDAILTPAPDAVACPSRPGSSSSRSPSSCGAFAWLIVRRPVRDLVHVPDVMASQSRVRRPRLDRRGRRRGAPPGGTREGQRQPGPARGPATTIRISSACCAAAIRRNPPSADPGVGVQAGDEDLHHHDVERQAGEAEQLDVVGTPAAPAGGGPGVQERGVEDPGDEGPGLHRVPAPVPPQA